MIFLPKHLNLDKTSFSLQSQRTTFTHRDQLRTGTQCRRTRSAEGGGGAGGTAQSMRRVPPAPGGGRAPFLPGHAPLQGATAQFAEVIPIQDPAAISLGRVSAGKGTLRVLESEKGGHAAGTRRRRFPSERQPLPSSVPGSTGGLRTRTVTKTPGEGLIQKRVFDNDLFHRTKCERLKSPL